MPHVLVLGGARSGKSRFAEDLAGRFRERTYLATAEAGDAEMVARIREHRARRGSDWRTVEEPLALAETLATTAAPGRAVLVDCLTLWLSNLLGADRPVVEEYERLRAALDGLPGLVILVSNEVGLGIVPNNALARAFRDHAGRVHQAVAERAAAVYFCVAGHAMPVKPAPPDLFDSLLREGPPPP